VFRLPHLLHRLRHREAKARKPLGLKSGIAYEGFVADYIEGNWSGPLVDVFDQGFGKYWIGVSSASFVISLHHVRC